MKLKRNHGSIESSRNSGNAKSTARRPPPGEDGGDEGDQGGDEEQGRQDGIEGDPAVQLVFREEKATDGRRREEARPEGPQEAGKTFTGCFLSANLGCQSLEQLLESSDWLSRD